MSNKIIQFLNRGILQAAGKNKGKGKFKFPEKDKKEISPEKKELRKQRTIEKKEKKEPEKWQ